MQSFANGFDVTINDVHGNENVLNNLFRRSNLWKSDHHKIDIMRISLINMLDWLSVQSNKKDGSINSVGSSGSGTHDTTQITEPSSKTLNSTSSKRSAREVSSSTRSPSTKGTSAEKNNNNSTNSCINASDGTTINRGVGEPKTKSTVDNSDDTGGKNTKCS